MTGDEIISALEHCSSDEVGLCHICPLDGECNGDITVLLKYALDLINRQKAEIDELKLICDKEKADRLYLVQANEALIAGQKTLQKALAEKNEEFENQSQNFKVLVSDHRTLQQSFDNLKCLYESEKAKVEKAKEKSIYFAKELQTAKKEIERLSDQNHKCIYLSDDETTECCVDGPCPKFKTESKIKTEAIKECLEWVLSLFPEDKNFTTISRFTVNRKLKEMVGEK